MLDTKHSGALCVFIGGITLGKLPYYITLGDFSVLNLFIAISTVFCILYGFYLLGIFKKKNI